MPRREEIAVYCDSHMKHTRRVGKRRAFLC